MSDTEVKTGHCLCQAVSFSAPTDNNVVSCHCSMCQRWNGSPQMAVSCGQDVSFEGEENISVYRSSDWAERGFCRLCGSHLFYRYEENHYMMLAGLFEDNHDFKFVTQYFIDNKPSFYSFENETTCLTSAEIAQMKANANADN